MKHTHDKFGPRDFTILHYIFAVLTCTKYSKSLNDDFISCIGLINTDYFLVKALFRVVDAFS